MLESEKLRLKALHAPIFTIKDRLKKASHYLFVFFSLLATFVISLHDYVAMPLTLILILIAGSAFSGSHQVCCVGAKA
jgi:hypothetical protein